MSKLKVCNRCGGENGVTARKCVGCGSSKFAPPWVVAKRPINRQVGVEITIPNPEFGKAEKRITLSKWWPGGRASFHVPHVAQWQAIQSIINNELGPLLGWKTRKEVIAELADQKKSASSLKISINSLIKKQPEFIKDIVGAIDAKKLGKADFERLLEIFGSLADAMSNANTGFREAFLGVVKKLPAQKQRALEDLSLLLEGWSLQQVTSVAQEVRSRIQTIDLFKRQIRDPRTYEINGDNSIHRILERAMWLIDERYWLLLSNATLRTFIGDELSKRDRARYSKKRPDFACGSVGEKLIIIELKRPAHTLEIEDVNQLETYLTVAEEYKTFRSCEAYLIGNKKGVELGRRMKHRSSSFQVLTYTDLIEDTELRYRDFLKSVTSDTTDATSRAK